jgi:EAL domain-containing protein (putative c-di-GMP-specific phosphodiesterase class I)
MIMYDMESSIRILKRLKDVGVSLSVDDFGTGYSSLSYLKKLPVDIVKIDISFVREVTRDQDAASIVTAITSLARSLNLKTIAEGVETEEQRNILHLLRCDMGQGYYFSPAIPPAEFDIFLAQERKPFAK